MKDYYNQIFLKLIETSNELDDLVIKNIVDVVRNINYIDTLLDINYNEYDLSSQ